MDTEYTYCNSKYDIYKCFKMLLRISNSGIQDSIIHNKKNMLKSYRTLNEFNIHSELYIFSHYIVIIDSNFQIKLFPLKITFQYYIIIK
jgi:hypothetical protein